MKDRENKDFFHFLHPLKTLKKLNKMNKALENLIRPHYRTLTGYVSAGMEAEKDDTKVFMNANENPYTLPGLEGLNRYPQPQPKALLQRYAELYKVEDKHIVMTRGADEAIVVLTNLFCEPHKNAIIQCPPAFGMYSRSANVMPVNVIDVPLLESDGTFALDVNGIIEAAKHKDAKLIFLCNPNNPTGTAFAPKDILRICNETEGHAAIILDETYAEFSKVGSLSDALVKTPNLIILRTLSKSYALAGARMGTLLCGDSDFIQLIRAKSLDAYPLPTSSIKAALKVMEPENLKQAKENIQTLVTERDRLRAAFKASKFVEHIYPSDANFLLIRMKNAKGFIEFCAAENIVLRDFTDKPMTQNGVRISPDLPKNNDRLIELLKIFEVQKAA